MNIEEIKLLLLVEQTKTSVYKEIIRSNLSIKLKETEDESLENSIRALVDNFNLISETQFQLVETNCEFIIEEDDEDSIQEQLKGFYTDIQNTRAYRKIFTSLKNFKTDLLYKIQLNEYIQITKTQVETLYKIFKEKKYSDKKINDNLILSLSTLDLRLLRYNNEDVLKLNLDFGNNNAILEVDQIQQLNKCVQKSFVSFASFEVFNKFSICKQFFNYSFIVNSIRYLMEIFVKNTKNIIFVELKKNKEDDYFSFYTLNKLVDNKKHWTMDCRLDDLTNHLMINLLPYLIRTFRKMYYDVFHDNMYRSHYASENIILEYDCEQLLQNICLIANFYEFSNLLRDLVKTHNSYKKTTNDWFNILTDDSLQKKSYKEKNKNDDYIDTIKLLFDDISRADCLLLYEKKIM